jgi:hypothetical protein
MPDVKQEKRMKNKKNIADVNRTSAAAVIC